MKMKMGMTEGSSADVWKSTDLPSQCRSRLHLKMGTEVCGYQMIEILMVLQITVAGAI